MGLFRLTDVSDTSRETKAYWDQRVTELWDTPTHGLYLAGHSFATMDLRNYEILRDLIGQLSNNGKKSVKVLECACGYGRYFGFVKGCHGGCANYRGIDLADKSVREAQRLFGTMGLFQVADMLTYNDGTKYDLIFMVTAWSSIEQKSAEVIAHLKTLLAAGGKLAVLEEQLYMVIDA